MNATCENLDYQVIERIATPSEYLSIVRHFDWAQHLTPEAVSIALQHSLIGVIIEFNNQVVGMGRIVGDNTTVFMIHDIWVIPSFQNSGLEMAVLDALLMYLEKHAPDQALILSLPLSSQITLFEQLGFRTTAPDAFGMFRIINRAFPDHQRINWG